MTRGTIRPTTRLEAVSRATAMLGFLGVPPTAPNGTQPSPIGYRLEPGHNGGSDPLADHCGSPSYGHRVWTADCVGLVLWALGIDRLQPGFLGVSGEWLHCPSIIADAERGQKYFEPIDYGRADPGDVLVTADHVGLILRPARGEFDHLVVDCSPRHGRRNGVGTGGPWSDACRALRYRLFSAAA